MDKAMHSEFEGHKSEWDEILRGNDAKRFMEIMKSSKPLSEAEIKRIRENYERMAKIESPDLLKENQSLRSELQKLKELNAELVAGLENIQIGLTAMNWARDLDEKDQKEKYVFDLLESLIKKSKES